MTSTRDRILGLLKRRKRATARELAAALGITPPGARQHLQALEREGLVAGRDEKRPMGRPVRVWALTPAAEPRFPTAYGPLALDLLRLLRKSGGARAVERLLARRRQALLTLYRRRVKRGAGAARAWAALAKLRDTEGYVCESTVEDGRPMLTEHHCPIRAVAAEFPEVCRQEHLLFEAVLGRPLERAEHLVAGGACCRYVPRAGQAAGATRRRASPRGPRPKRRRAAKPRAPRRSGRGRGRSRRRS